MSKLGRVYYADRRIDFDENFCTLYTKQGNTAEEPFHVLTQSELGELIRSFADLLNQEYGRERMEPGVLDATTHRIMKELQKP
jgi:hypothetical protein